MEQRLHTHAVGLITKLLRDRTGQVLSEDRSWRIDRAIETVLQRRGLPRHCDVITLLTQPDSAAVETELVEELLNNETYFFRDRQVFDCLANSIVPQLAQVKQASRRLQIWSAGCSTGQEALSLGMMFLAQRHKWQGWNIDIFASDISQNAITLANEGIYSQFEIQRGLGVHQMLEFFDETPRGWQAKPVLRRMVRYRVANILEPAPATQTYDLILCRNLLLYLDTFFKTLACRNLAASLAPHGKLLIGGGETLIEQADLLVPDRVDCSIYRLAKPAPHSAAA